MISRQKYDILSKEVEPILARFTFGMKKSLKMRKNLQF